MFEKATKMKLRFITKKGSITVEDLWDLPLIHKNGTSLDIVAKNINKKLKESEEESFVVESSKENEILKLKLDILKHIIATKLADKKAKEDAVLAKQNRNKIIKIIAHKEDEILAEKTIEELKKLL